MIQLHRLPDMFCINVGYNRVVRKQTKGWYFVVYVHFRLSGL